MLKKRYGRLSFYCTHHHSLLKETVKSKLLGHFNNSLLKNCRVKRITPQKIIARFQFIELVHSFPKDIY